MSNEIMRNEIIVTVAKGGTKLSLNGNKTYLRKYCSGVSQTSLLGMPLHRKTITLSM